MQSVIFVVLAALTIYPTTLLADETVIWKNDVRGWDVMVDRTLENSCFIYSTFEESSFVRLQFNPVNDSVEFTVGNLNWISLESGKLYPMEVQFGSRTPWTGEGLGRWWGEDLPSLSLDVPFKDDRALEFLDEFMKMTGVRVSYENRIIANLSLRGTYAATEEMMRCQRKMFESSPAPTDPFKSNSSSENADPFD